MGDLWKLIFPKRAILKLLSFSSLFSPPQYFFLGTNKIQALIPREDHFESGQTIALGGRGAKEGERPKEKAEAEQTGLLNSFGSMHSNWRTNKSKRTAKIVKYQQQQINEDSNNKEGKPAFTDAKK